TSLNLNPTAGDLGRGEAACGVVLTGSSTGPVCPSSCWIWATVFSGGQPGTIRSIGIVVTGPSDPDSSSAMRTLRSATAAIVADGLTPSELGIAARSRT